VKITEANLLYYLQVERPSSQATNSTRELKQRILLQQQQQWYY